MSEKSIEAKIHKVYLNDQYKSGGSEVRLVSWIVNGKANQVRLERRDYFLKGEEGFKISGKAKGFNLKDVQFILAHPEILDEMMAINKQQFEKKPSQEASVSEDVYAGSEDDPEDWKK